MLQDRIRLTLDTSRRMQNGTFYVKQNDAGTRMMDITIMTGSAPVDLTGCRVVLFVEKPSGMRVFSPVTVTDAVNGVLSAELTDQTLAEAGRLQCEITIYGETGSVLSTLSSDEILVSPTLRNDAALESTNEFSALTKAITEVKAVVINAETQSKAAGDAAASAQEKANAAEYAATQANAIRAQIQSDLDAGKLKGDRGTTGDVGAQGPTGPRGFPGGVSQMVTLPLPCTVPIGADEETAASVTLENYSTDDSVTVISRGVNLFDPGDASGWSTENAAKTTIGSVAASGAICLTCSGSGATVTSPVFSVTPGQTYTLTREISGNSALTGTFYILECGPDGSESGTVLFTHNNILTAQRSYLFTASSPYIKLKWAAVSAVYGELQIRYEVDKGDPYGMTSGAAGADLGLSLLPYHRAAVPYAAGGVTVPVWPGGAIVLNSKTYSASAEIRFSDVILLDTTLTQDVDLIQLDRNEGHALYGLTAFRLSVRREGKTEKITSRYAPGGIRALSEYAADGGIDGSFSAGDRIQIKGE